MLSKNDMMAFFASGHRLG